MLQFDELRAFRSCFQRFPGRLSDVCCSRGLSPAWQRSALSKVGERFEAVDSMVDCRSKFTSVIVRAIPGRPLLRVMFGRLRH